MNRYAIRLSLFCLTGGLGPWKRGATVTSSQSSVLSSPFRINLEQQRKRAKSAARCHQAISSRGNCPLSPIPPQFDASAIGGTVRPSERRAVDHRPGIRVAKLAQIESACRSDGARQNGDRRPEQCAGSRAFHLTYPLWLRHSAAAAAGRIPGRLSGL